MTDVFSKRRKNYYTDPKKDIYVTNVSNGNNNIVTILTVPDNSNYIPPYTDRFINCDYMPDVRLIAKEYKSGYNYYVFDINFTLTKDEEISDSVVNYLIKHIFDLNME